MVRFASFFNGILMILSKTARIKKITMEHIAGYNCDIQLLKHISIVG
jgi:hypothetical protein